MTSKMASKINKNSKLLSISDFFNILERYDSIGITVLDGNYFGQYLVYKHIGSKSYHAIVDDKHLARRAAKSRRSA